MSRTVSWLFKWSLEITGGSIIVFNYWPYESRERVVGMYRSAVNSARSVYYLYGVYGEFKDIASLDQGTQAYLDRVEGFKSRSAEKVRALCEVNSGVYARIGQIVSSMTGVLPSQLLSQLKKLNNIETAQIPYQRVKTALTKHLPKPMGEIFDGFQRKPFSRTLFWQTHRSVLLQNYRESLIKIMLPSTKYQSQYDLAFINKILAYLKDYIANKNPSCLQQFNRYDKIIREAQKITLSQIDFKQEMQNVEKIQSLMYEPNSSFYIPYYYKKYASDHVIIRQFIEGATLADKKGLKEMGLSAQIAYAVVMSQIQRMINRYGVVDRKMKGDSVILRRYIKPVRRNNVEEGRKGKTVDLVLPKHQVVFLNINNLQEIPQSTKEHIHSFWQNIKKTSKNKRVKPSTQNFYKYLPNFNNIKDNSQRLLQQKYYLYEPMLNLFEEFVSGREEIRNQMQ